MNTFQYECFQIFRVKLLHWKSRILVPHFSYKSCILVDLYNPAVLSLVLFLNVLAYSSSFFGKSKLPSLIYIELTTVVAERGFN